MTRLLICLVTSVVLATASVAQQDDGAGIQNTIKSQIEAFQADDFERAFGFASPGIRTLFQSPDNFGAMVRNGYPMVWRPAEVKFLELREIAGFQWQKVLVRDSKGVVHILDYQMVEFDNVWKINGVQILDAPGAAA